MKKYFNILLTIIFLSFPSFGCSDNDPVKEIEETPGTGNGNNSGDDEDEEEPPLPSQNSMKTVTIDVGAFYQEMEGFGASDCWTPHYVGSLWAEDQKESIAKLLFSQKIVNGKPEGIGLSMWRFNLGAGTAEQGDESDIEDKSRRSESFLNEDGSYDWNKQAGQQYFIEKAKEYGCEKYVMFSNSPPVQYTYNGKGYSRMNEYSNLKEEHYDDFATYMVNVANYFKTNKGIEFDFISPVNEPQYNWPNAWEEPSQEGSGWQNSEMKKLAVALNNALEKTSLNTNILLAEAGDWTYLYTSNNAGRSNVIVDLFGNSSENYIGNLSRVPNIVCGHSYWTDDSWTRMQQVRQQVYASASGHGLKLYQTEWSMLGDNYDNDYVGHDNSSEWDIAAYMSKVLYQDLAIANVSSWSYWTSMDVARWNHKNRFLLINLIPQGGSYADITGSGRHEDTKSLWALGHYSLFIRPGYKRINLEIKDLSKNFFGTGYISPDGNQLVCVYTNLIPRTIEIVDEIVNSGKSFKPVKQYITSATQNMEEVTNEDNLNLLPSQSIVTVIYE